MNVCGRPCMSSREEAQWNDTNGLCELMEHFLHPKKEKRRGIWLGLTLGICPWHS